MASTTKTHTAEKTSILGSLLHPALPLDTDGLLGLMDAPEVYDLILRDLREDDVLTNRHAATDTDLQDNQDGVLKKGRRPGSR